MKVILLKDVKKVGKKDQIVDVADGYARNYLIPNKLAVISSGTGKEILEKQQSERAHQYELDKQEAIKVKEKLEKIVLSFPVKVGKDGRVFGSISTKQIEEAYAKEYDIKVDKRKFKPSGPVTNLGTNKIEITLFPEVVANVKVQLVAKE